MIVNRLKSKTYWFGVSVIAAGYLEANTRVISQLIPENYRALAVSTLGVIVLLLREVTKAPLSDKTEQ